MTSACRARSLGVSDRRMASATGYLPNGHPTLRPANYSPIACYPCLLPPSCLVQFGFGGPHSLGEKAPSPYRSSATLASRRRPRRGQTVSAAGYPPIGPRRRHRWQRVKKEPSTRIVSKRRRGVGPGECDLLPSSEFWGRLPSVRLWTGREKLESPNLSRSQTELCSSSHRGRQEHPRSSYTRPQTQWSRALPIPSRFSANP